ncbi:Met-10+ like-protein-domain-containing protein [Scheffersomyces xylosifermentans]|uniref:Met-10+ like-protein-domain-containing protein n=1 Tax=Scheffersomyces xylosifermentans TaxID=1304137 RepID=UPI00315C5297
MLRSFLAFTKHLHTIIPSPVCTFVSARNFHKINKTDRREFMMSIFGAPVNRSMKQLDRSFFHKEVPLLVACFPDPKHLGQFVKSCKKDILYLPSIKHIVPVDDSKGVLLRADIGDINTYENNLSDIAKAKIKEYGVVVKPYTMTLEYDFWKTDDILRAVLPENLLDDIPTGFAQAGHVAHLNLRDEFKPFGSLIGQVILDKNSKVETVVDKVDSIATKFRTFKMNILAGKDDLLVEQSESGCRFKFDFSKVYWNSRLNTEHERLIDGFKPHEVVADVFAGVGPFAVPAGKKEVVVLANDLNPESYKYLQENIKINHTEDFVHSYNLDGREFIRESPKLLLDWSHNSSVIKKSKVVKRRKTNPETKEKQVIREEQVTEVEIPSFIGQYVMNLPDSAITFLDEFIGLYSRDPEVEKAVRSDPNFKLPVINCHCFEKYTPQEQPEPSLEVLYERVRQRVIKMIDHDIPIEKFQFHLVRRVAPTKPMFCVSFELPEEVAFRK